MASLFFICKYKGGIQFNLKNAQMKIVSFFKDRSWLADQWAHLGLIFILR